MRCREFYLIFQIFSSYLCKLESAANCFIMESWVVVLVIESMHPFCSTGIALEQVLITGIV
jgi:hypothetical protein